MINAQPELLTRTQENVQEWHSRCYCFRACPSVTTTSSRFRTSFHLCLHPRLSSSLSSSPNKQLYRFFCHRSACAGRSLRFQYSLLLIRTSFLSSFRSAIAFRLFFRVCNGVVCFASATESSASILRQSRLILFCNRNVCFPSATESSTSLPQQSRLLHFCDRTAFFSKRATESFPQASRCIPDCLWLGHSLPPCSQHW